MQLRCSKCKQEKDSTKSFAPKQQRAAGYRVCRDCVSADNRARYTGPRKRSPEELERRQATRRASGSTEEGKKRTADVWFRHRYGLTIAEVDAKIAEQGGVCALCHQAETRTDPRTGEPRRLSVDHDHATGRVRAMLCFRCNWVLAQVRDNPVLLDDMATYVRHHGAMFETGEGV